MRQVCLHVLRKSLYLVNSIMLPMVITSMLQRMPPDVSHNVCHALVSYANSSQKDSSIGPGLLA